MAGEANLCDKIETIENILMGDPKKPDTPGVLENVRKNTEFRQAWQKLLWRFYMVLAGMVAIQLFDLIKNKIGG